MAGESPDRSEQKQSSGETAGSERDPRLAVLRDAPTDTETSAESDSVAADTKTDGAEADGTSPEGAKSDGEKSAGGEAGGTESDSAGAKPGAEEPGAGKGAPEKGDARLKAAVAAWVAGKDASEDAEGAEKAETPEGASEGASRAAEEPAGDTAEGGADTEAEDAATDGGDAEPALPVRKPGGKGKKAAGQVDQPTAVFGTVTPKSAPADEATRVFAAVNPKDAKKGGADAEETAKKGAEAADAESAKDAEGTKKGTEDAKKSAEARKATAAAIPKRSETAKKAAAKGEEAKAEETKGEAAAEVVEPVESAEPGKDAGNGSKGADDSPKDGSPKEGKATPDSETGSKADGKAAAEADGKKAGDKKAGDKKAGSAAAAAEKPATEKPATEPKADEKSGADKSGADKSDADKDGAAKKAAEKPAGQTKNAEKSGTDKPAAEKSDTDKPAAERDAERTSQFVALKSADERPAKPPKPVGKPTDKADKADKAPADPAATAALPAVAPAPAPGPQPAAAQPSPAASEGKGTPGPLPESERTKQQPLPPLDLLAQLTNTPPPPETPIRTIVRRFKIWTPLVLLLLLVFVIVQAVRPLPDPTLALTSDATYSFDGSKPSMPWPSEGQAYVEISGLGPIGSYGDQKPVPIGSVAKTMTAYIIMRDHPLKPGKTGPKIRIDKQAEEDGKKGAGHGDESVLDTVKEGDTITQKDALSAVMIPSANNIARLLARWDAGSQEAFVKKMNATAKELGMKNTTYTDPSGLIETTVSTAEDQVKLGKKAMEFPALVDITKLPSWKDPSGKEWRNYNTLPPYNNAIGIKTGSTSKAGGNLLFAGRQQVGDTTQLIVGAVLGQHRTPIIDTANAVSKELLTTAQGALEDRTVVKKGDVVGVVDDGLGGTTPVVATADVKAVGWSGLTVKLGLTDKGKTIPHAAKAGTKVGVLTAGSGPGQVKVPVALQKDLTEPAFGAKLTRVG